MNLMSCFVVTYNNNQLHPFASDLTTWEHEEVHPASISLHFYQLFGSILFYHSRGWYFQLCNSITPAMHLTTGMYRPTHQPQDAARPYVEGILHSHHTIFLRFHIGFFSDIDKNFSYQIIPKSFLWSEMKLDPCYRLHAIKVLGKHTADKRPVSRSD